MPVQSLLLVLLVWLKVSRATRGGGPNRSIAVVEAPDISLIDFLAKDYIHEYKLIIITRVIDGRSAPTVALDRFEQT